MVDQQKDDIKEDEEEEEDDDGPPPGFHSSAWPTETNKYLSAEQNDVDKVEAAAEEGECEDVDMEAPPPGWSPFPLHHIHTSDVDSNPVQLNTLQQTDVEMSENQEELEDEDGPPPGWNLILPTSQPNDREMRSHQEAARVNDEGPQPGHKVATPSQLLPPNPPPTQPASSLPSAHQVGQVKCARCTVLLMYSEGAPSVRCCSCRIVTEIGPHNRRRPLSVQQATKLSSVNHVH